MEENHYNNGSLSIQRYDNTTKNELITFILDLEQKELNELNISQLTSYENKIDEKAINDLITKEEIEFYYLQFKSNNIGLFCLNNNNNISFIVKKEKRNKGFGKIGLHLLIKELSISKIDIKEYLFKVKKNNISAILTIYGNNATILEEKENEYLLKISKDNNIWIHKVHQNDMDKVLKITESAKKMLKRNGSLQWQQGYPNEQTFLNDIKNGTLYGLYEDDILKGYGAYIYGLDVNYVEINGKWDIPANEKDLAIHRVAVDENSHGKKYGAKILKYGIQYAKKLGCITVKVDTHKNNIPMQKTISKCGFIYKGIIKILRDKFDNLRLAYEIVL